jgi:leucyl-tRNA---protein transferase
VRLSIDTLEEQLYLGHLGGDCPYLPGRDSRLLFLNGQGVGKIYRLLMDAGYRRHGLHVYRPDCPGCQECRILRVPIETFRPSRSQRRVWKRGSLVFRVEWGTPAFTPEKIAMYERYLAYQHGRPGSAENDPADPDRYSDFFVQSFLGDDTRELRLFAGDRLVGIGIVDILFDALSSVYFFFEPDYYEFSPGTFSILVEIESGRGWGLKYYYPGYFIRECPTMNYKKNFGPNQIKSRLGTGWGTANNE